MKNKWKEVLFLFTSWLNFSRQNFEQKPAQLCIYLRKRKLAWFSFTKLNQHRSYKSKAVNHKEKSEKLSAFKPFLWLVKNRSQKSLDPKTKIFFFKVCGLLFLSKSHKSSKIILWIILVQTCWDQNLARNHATFWDHIKISFCFLDSKDKTTENQCLINRLRKITKEKVLRSQIK